jgi:hypothetical protein
LQASWQRASIQRVGAASTIELLKSFLIFRIYRAVREPVKVLLLSVSCADTGAVPTASIIEFEQPTVGSPSENRQSPGSARMASSVSMEITGRAIDAAVSRFESSAVDLYFGIIVPGGRIFSWISGTANIPILVVNDPSTGQGL